MLYDTYNEVHKVRNVKMYQIKKRGCKMNGYDYREAVKDDILTYIEENIDFKDFETLDDLAEQLNDDLFVEDSVTGNASGSYTFSNYEAEENLCHNLDLLGEALEEFGCGPDYLIEKGAEACDVTIRCYLLGGCISEVMEEIEEEFEEAKAR